MCAIYLAALQAAAGGHLCRRSGDDDNVREDMINEELPRSFGRLEGDRRCTTLGNRFSLKRLEFVVQDFECFDWLTVGTLGRVDDPSVPGRKAAQDNRQQVPTSNPNVCLLRSHLAEVVDKKYGQVVVSAPYHRPTLPYFYTNKSLLNAKSFVKRSRAP